MRNASSAIADDRVNHLVCRVRPEKLLKTSGNRSGNVYVFKRRGSAAHIQNPAIADPDIFPVSHELRETDNHLHDGPGIFLDERVARDAKKIHLALAFFACSLVIALAVYSYYFKAVDSQLDPVQELKPVADEAGPVYPETTNRAAEYQHEIQLLESRNNLLREELDELSEETTELNRELLLKELGDVTTKNDVLYKYIDVPLGSDLNNLRSNSNASPL